jgi:hypothetical protein
MKRVFEASTLRIGSVSAPLAGALAFGAFDLASVARVASGSSGAWVRTDSLCWKTLIEKSLEILEKRGLAKHGSISTGKDNKSSSRSSRSFCWSEHERKVAKEKNTNLLDRLTIKSGH